MIVYHASDMTGTLFSWGHLRAERALIPELIQNLKQHGMDLITVELYVVTILFKE